MAEKTNTNEPANGVYGVLTAGNCKPILFSTLMVQAILRGEKTQTRRIIKKPDILDMISQGFLNNAIMLGKYRVGNILWVRETWHPKRHNMPTGCKYEYKATAKEDGNPTDEPWKPSIFMPKDACRIFLKIKNIRIERLDAISETDAIKEGIELIDYNCFKNYMQGKDWFYNHKNQNGFEMLEDPIGSFFSLWALINGNDSLNENPWVFVYEFERTDASFACR